MPRYKRKRASTTYRRKRNYGRRNVFTRRKGNTRYGARRTNSKARFSLVKGLGPSADAIFVKLKYTSQSTAVWATQTPTYWTGNGPFDPQVSVGGDSCTGWAQYAALYADYICHGSTIKFTYRQTDADVGSWFVIPNREAPGSFLPQNLAVYPYMKRKKTNPSQGTGKNTVIVKHAFFNKKMYPLIGSKDSLYSAATTANPSLLWYWMVVYNNDNDTTASAGVWDIEIIYYITFGNRYQVAIT